MQNEWFGSVGDAVFTIIMITVLEINIPEITLANMPVVLQSILTGAMNRSIVYTEDPFVFLKRYFFDLEFGN